MKAEGMRLRQEIAAMLAEARAADEAEDLQHGRDRHGDELPDELARRQGRLAKIEEARKLLEKRARIETAVEAARRQAEGKSTLKVAPEDAREWNKPRAAQPPSLPARCHPWTYTPRVRG